MTPIPIPQCNPTGALHRAAARQYRVTRDLVAGGTRQPARNHCSGGLARKVVVRGTPVHRCRMTACTALHPPLESPAPQSLSCSCPSHRRRSARCKQHVSTAPPAKECGGWREVLRGTGGMALPPDFFWADEQGFVAQLFTVRHNPATLAAQGGWEVA